MSAEEDEPASGASEAEANAQENAEEKPQGGAPERAEQTAAASRSGVDAAAMTDPDLGGRPRRRRRPPRKRLLFFGVWGAVVLAVLWLSRAVLLPFFLAVVVAYVLAPVVRWLQERQLGSWSPPRWVAVVIVYLALLGVLGAFTAVGVPRLAAEVQKLAREVPEAVSTVREEWLPWVETRFRAAMREYGEATPAPAPEAPDVVTSAAAEDTGSIRIQPTPEGGWAVRLPEEGLVIEPRGDRYRVVEATPREEESGDLSAAFVEALRATTENTRQTAATVLRTAQAVIKAVVKGVFTFFIMLMLSAYLLATSESILAFLRSLWPRARRRSFDRLTLRMDRGLSGVVRGQLLIALVNGVLSGIGFYALELRYWPILTLIATALSIIPIFGAIISTIPAVVIALQNGPGTALLVLAWIVVVHQIEANLLNPKIMGDAAKVHPVLVVFALLAGESLFGIAGALLAVPMLSIVQSLFLHYREVMLGVPASRSSPGTELAPE